MIGAFLSGVSEVGGGLCFCSYAGVGCGDMMVFTCGNHVNDPGQLS
jgi:hypothetical protein